MAVRQGLRRLQRRRLSIRPSRWLIATVSLGERGINTGTVPSKTLRETALALSGLKSRKLYGVDLSLRRTVTISDFLGHEQNIRSIFNTSLSKRLEAQHADVFYGTASFVDPHTISVQPASDSTNQDGNQMEKDSVLLYGETIQAAERHVSRGSIPTHAFGLQAPSHGRMLPTRSCMARSHGQSTMAAFGAIMVGMIYFGCILCRFWRFGPYIVWISRAKLLPFHG